LFYFTVLLRLARLLNRGADAKCRAGSTATSEVLATATPSRRVLLTLLCCASQSAIVDTRKQTACLWISL
jgi:hypothetical protein